MARSGSATARFRWLSVSMSPMYPRGYNLPMRRWLVGLVASAAVALPAYAAAPEAVQRGEQLFFEHSFGPTASSVPLAVFQALQRQDARFRPEALGERYGLLFKPGRELPIGFVGA